MIGDNSAAEGGECLVAPELGWFELGVSVLLMDGFGWVIGRDNV